MSRQYTTRLGLLTVDPTEPLTTGDLQHIFQTNLSAIDSSVYALEDRIQALANAGHTPVAPLTLSGNALKYRIENASTLFDIPTLLRSLPSGTPVRVTGFTMTLASVSALTAFYDLLDTLTGLDANMGGLTKAQMHGTIRLVTPTTSSSSSSGGSGGLTGGSIAGGSSGSGTASLITVTGEQLAAWRGRYPSITVIPERIENHVYYYNYDGSELLYDETIYDNADAAYSNVPSRDASGGYMYSFVGWSSDSNSSTADAVLTNVTENRSVYAAYVRAQNVPPTVEMSAYSSGISVPATVRVTNWGAYPRLMSLTSSGMDGSGVTAQAGGAVLSVSGDLITITPTENHYNAIAWSLTFADNSGSARCNVAMNLKNIPSVSVMKKSSGTDDPVILDVSSFGRYPTVKSFTAKYTHNRNGASSTIETYTLTVTKAENISVSDNVVTLTPYFVFQNYQNTMSVEPLEVKSAYVTFATGTDANEQTVNIPLDMFDISASA